ncbi:hypothetical protein GWN63_04215 [Candidatus Bathyarchaeota archaeon]|nr:hypothetical protein [Candidatus Bathyarchaeota archaeon]
MANWIGNNGKLREFLERKKSGLTTQKLFGIIKGVYRRMNRSDSPITYPTDELVKATRDYPVEFERRKSEALAHWSRWKVLSPR